MEQHGNIKFAKTYQNVGQGAPLASSEEAQGIFCEKNSDLVNQNEDNLKPMIESEASGKISPITKPNFEGETLSVTNDINMGSPSPVIGHDVNNAAGSTKSLLKDIPSTMKQQSKVMLGNGLVKWGRSKRRSTRKGPYSNIADIKRLPRDLLVEVVATVASHSFIDFHAIKMCCKDFLDATKDSYVWQRLSLDAIPLIQWHPNDKTSSFLNHCMECENMEGIYREGLKKYFNYPNGNIDGLEILKVAAQKGHKEAKYVCGMILLCSENDKLKKQGLEYMRFLRKSKCVVGSRNKVKQLVDSMWKNNGILQHNQNPICNSKSTCKGWRVKMGRWVLLDDDDDDDKDISLCEYCRWDYELELFYRMVNAHF